MVSGTVIIVPSASTGQTAVKEHLVICEFDGCEEPAKKHRKLCSGHQGQRARHQTLRPLHTSYGRPTKDVVKYATAHWRVRKSRGKAGEHPCVDCGGTAESWSLNHDSVNILIEVGGQADGMPYSLNHEDYDPRCYSCHGLLDQRR